MLCPIDPEDKDANTDSMVVEGAVDAASGGENMDIPAVVLVEVLADVSTAPPSLVGARFMGFDSDAVVAGASANGDCCCLQIFGWE